MERKQIIARLLLTYILLAASLQCHNFVAIMVHAIDTVKVEQGTKQLESQSVVGYALPTTEKSRQEVQAMKKKKVPSGPNPIGNRHPPSQP